MIIRSFFCLILLIILQSSPAQNTPASSSVLSTGTWFKIKVYKNGIYKLTYEDLQGMGIASPAAVRVFGNGGKTLPLMNADPRPDDLVENAVYMHTGTDGVFNQGDFILFYGRGPVTWNYSESTGMFEHQVHPYSKVSYYFITDGSGEGRKIAAAQPVTGSSDITVTGFDDYAYHEKNLKNFLKSGRQWFGERIDYSTLDTTFVFNGLLSEVPVKVKANVLSRSANTKYFSFKNNSQIIGTIGVNSVILSNSTGTHANQTSALFIFSVPGNEINLNISYNKTASSDEGFLDYLTVNVRRNLNITGDELFFRNRFSAGTGSIALFTVGSSTAATQIWDVTDSYNIRKIESQLNGNTLTFKDSTNTIKEYVAVNPGGVFPKPDISLSDFTGPVTNQNLHATGPHQMLIITHPLFRAAADSVAEFHRQQDNMSVFVATTDEVYNEFSSGAPDVSAIRDFARMIRNRSTGSHNLLKYLLLFGDGSYNNHSHAAGNSNYVLTYQSASSLNASTSYVSDDFFGFMDENEGGSENMESYLLDLGVGRLPAKNADEAMILYRKIRNYNSEKNRVDWRNNILFIGDDEDGNLHMNQANSLADWVRDTYPQFVVKKILLDAYKQVSASTGARYPEVNRNITDNIHKGILIYNYTGHGGERGMAAEQILMRDDLEKFTNANFLPLFVTATCEFSRFDDLTDDEGKLIESTSAGETSLLNEHGGSIALLSTTRIVYSDRNHFLNTKFYRVAFERDENGNYYKLGDVIRMTKDSTGVQRNKLNFILLGDPALTLAIPRFKVMTDSINSTAVNAGTDTLKAFSRIKVSGHLENLNNTLMSTFNGVVYPSVFDKKQTVTTLGNDGDDPMQFETQENLIYKGKASVFDGYFTFEFMVPKDITYSYGNGKIVYYAEDADSDANGFCTEFIIGGTMPGVVPDRNGPEIALFLNDENFNNSGITNTSPVIYALISDESGINTVGNGIGHDITGVIDGRVSEPIILNDFFETTLDDYRKGTLQYQLFDLEEGWHSLTVKVWDVFNNSSESTLAFNVLSGNRLIIADAYNYPNPAREFTSFTFEHNKPGEELQVTISIFDMDGRNVAELRETVFSGGFTSSPMTWDLRDSNGNYLSQGMYPYRIRINDRSGSFTESYKKLIILRQ
ncbi:MAG TPA: type IX secretion system sortase PorU [Bacteroidales bacterium]|nr:type IX secretion system sortase PorU [Bacteroidales bacterium]